MAYTTIDDPGIYFNTLLWSGDDTASRNLTGVGFQPDWIWGKARSRIGNHWLIDSVRGTTGSLYRVINADATDAEQTTNNDGTTAYGIVTTIGSDGFTIADGNQGDLNVNNSGDTYVAWNWKAGTTSSISGGSITSAAVSISATSGFGIYRYTGTGSNGTIAHGLGTAPKFIVTKNRDSGSYGWYVYHAGIGATKNLYLHNNDGEVTSSTRWNDTDPTSTLFTVSTNDGVNGSSANMIAYAFSEVKGYSKFGSYSGNGNTDGTFVYTGFKPAWVMVKRSDAAENWVIFDNKLRPANNVGNNFMYADISNAQDTSTDFDMLSNGFKTRTASAIMNGSGASYIYLAFAESPFVNSNGIPNNAR